MEVTTQTIKEFTLSKDEITEAIIEYIQQKKVIGTTDNFYHMTLDLFNGIKIDTSPSNGVRGIEIAIGGLEALTYLSKVSVQFRMDKKEQVPTKVKM